MSGEIQQPEVEIVVRHFGREIALIAYFPDGDGGYTCVVGMEDAAAVDVLSRALQQTSLNLSAVARDGVALVPVKLDADVVDGKRDHPF